MIGGATGRLVELAPCAAVMVKQEVVILNGIKKFDPVGCCIYCGRSGKGVELGDEHIIPFALGGKLLLQNACCKKCERDIGATIERQCMRRMFGDLRIRLGYPTRRPKERPKTLPVFLETETMVERHEMPVSSRPHVTMMFAFDEPGILRGLTPDAAELAQVPSVWVNTVTSEAARASARAIGRKARRIAVKGAFHPVLFGKLLAKIGHSFAIAELGFGSFGPLLPDAILGKTAWHPGYLVGGDPNPVPPSEYINEIGLRRPESKDGRKFIVVRIRLFADLGAPVYYVVAGET